MFGSNYASDNTLSRMVSSPVAMRDGVLSFATATVHALAIHPSSYHPAYFPLASANALPRTSPSDSKYLAIARSTGSSSKTAANADHVL